MHIWVACTAKGNNLFFTESWTQIACSPSCMQSPPGHTLYLVADLTHIICIYSRFVPPPSLSRFFSLLKLKKTFLPRPLRLSYCPNMIRHRGRNHIFRWQAGLFKLFIWGKLNVTSPAMCVQQPRRDKTKPLPPQRLPCFFFSSRCREWCHYIQHTGPQSNTPIWLITHSECQVLYDRQFLASRAGFFLNTWPISLSTTY